MPDADLSCYVVIVCLHRLHWSRYVVSVAPVRIVATSNASARALSTCICNPIRNFAGVVSTPSGRHRVSAAIERAPAVTQRHHIRTNLEWV